jgi:GPH family glycoside/pentoside/hexuronide:cation symporter
MGQALAFAKYINPSGSTELPVQPPAALNAIRIFMGPVPAALLLVSLLFAWRYNVTRESHQALVEQLNDRG